jgi:hypothetical protein
MDGASLQISARPPRRHCKKCDLAYKNGTHSPGAVTRSGRTRELRSMS